MHGGRGRWAVAMWLVAIGATGRAWAGCPSSESKSEPTANTWGYQGEDLWRETPGDACMDADPMLEARREACVNTRSLPWLPAVELPHPERPGQGALAWRPGHALVEPSRIWLVTTSVAAALTLALGLGLRRRPGWRRLALLPAMALPLAGLGLALRQLARLAEGLSSPWSCVPREGVFQRHAQLARDTLTDSALSSLVALVVLGIVALVAWRSWRPRVVATALPLLALTGWLAVGWWPTGPERALAQAVSEPLAAVAAQGVRLPTADRVAPVRLPDVPLVLVSADGTLRYDDSRGQQPATGSPLVLPAPRFGDLAKDDDDRPPFFLLAVDERTPWQALQRALEPLDERGYFQKHWLLYGPPSAPTPGSPPHAPAVPYWTPHIASHATCGTGLTSSSGDHDMAQSMDQGSPVVTVGWLDERGLRLQGGWASLAKDCGTLGDDVGLPHERLTASEVNRCIASVERLGEPEGELLVLLAPSPTTPWREVSMLLEAFARPRPRGSVRLNLWMAHSSAQADELLARQRQWATRSHPVVSRELEEALLERL